MRSPACGLPRSSGRRGGPSSRRAAVVDPRRALALAAAGARLHRQILDLAVQGAAVHEICGGVRERRRVEVKCYGTKTTVDLQAIKYAPYVAAARFRGRRRDAPRATTMSRRTTRERCCSTRGSVAGHFVKAYRDENGIYTAGAVDAVAVRPSNGQTMPGFVRSWSSRTSNHHRSDCKRPGEGVAPAVDRRDAMAR
jgi:hypothetical protein